MKSGLISIFALMVLFGAAAWVVHNFSAASPVAVMASGPGAAVHVPPAAPPRAIAPLAAPAAEQEPSPSVTIDSAGNVNYVARDGDTVSQLAIALLGSDSKQHRDMLIAANPSLQNNPDRVLMGQTYSIASSAIQSGVARNNTVDKTPDADDQTSTSAAKATVSAAPQPRPSDNNSASDDKAPVLAGGPRLKYIAQPGDSVAVLAGNLLGGNTKTNRDAIIASNASLQQDPNRLVAGQSYTIIAPNGLAADPTAPQAKASSAQPDADELAQLSVGRTLRYTALPGDTVSKMAVLLLGSDTPANRELIVRSNPTLKQDPDHLVAGQTYWIAAPTAPPAQ